MSMRSLPLQTVFDIVVTHLYTQGERSVSPQGECRYRNYRGLSCAVGCLIDDEQYSPEFEGYRLYHVNQSENLFTDEQTKLLAQMQDAHDHAKGRELAPWLIRIAKAAGVDYRAEHYPSPPQEWK